MIAQCTELGFDVPVWSITNTSVTVTFPNLSVPFNYKEGISEEISKGINKGTTGALKESMLEIIELLVMHKSLRASEIAEKLDKSYKTIET